MPGRAVLISNPLWNRPGTRRPTWNFSRHVLNTATGIETIEVYGGKNGHHHNHAFRPDEVRPKPTPRTRRRKS